MLKRWLGTYLPTGKKYFEVGPSRKRGVFQPASLADIVMCRKDCVSRPYVQMRLIIGRIPKIIILFIIFIITSLRWNNIIVTCMYCNITRGISTNKMMTKCINIPTSGYYEYHYHTYLYDRSKSICVVLL